MTVQQTSRTDAMTSPVKEMINVKVPIASSIARQRPYLPVTPVPTNSTGRHATIQSSSCLSTRTRTLTTSKARTFVVMSFATGTLIAPKTSSVPTYHTKTSEPALNIQINVTNQLRQSLARTT